MTFGDTDGDTGCGAGGVLLTGQSNSGKSALALQLIGLGARLVGDDMVRLESQDGVLVASAIGRLDGVIEARRVGLLRAPFQARTLVSLCVDMDQEEKERLPHTRVTNLLSCDVETIYKVSAAYFPAAIKQLVTTGRYL